MRTFVNCDNCMPVEALACDIFVSATAEVFAICQYLLYFNEVKSHTGIFNIIVLVHWQPDYIASKFQRM